MEILLEKRPKNPIIIEGFPGFGLVGTIATEFLIEHLKAIQIGKIIIHESPPVVAIHNSKVVEPLGIFYDKKNNIVILHAVSNISGLEWKISDILTKLVKDLNAKEVIGIEGVGGSTITKEINAFYISYKDGFSKVGIEPLKEGIIMGVTGALLLKKKLPLSCIFIETHSRLPDSRAAAKAIEILDRYIGLKVDYKPLIKQAEKFEDKLKGIFDKTKDASKQKAEKELNYLG